MILLTFVADCQQELVRTPHSKHKGYWSGSWSRDNFLHRVKSHCFLVYPTAVTFVCGKEAILLLLYNLNKKMSVKSFGVTWCRPTQQNGTMPMLPQYQKTVRSQMKMALVETTLRISPKPSPWGASEVLTMSLRLTAGQERQRRSVTPSFRGATFQPWLPPWWFYHKIYSIWCFL